MRNGRDDVLSMQFVSALTLCPPHLSYRTSCKCYNYNQGRRKVTKGGVEGGGGQIESKGVGVGAIKLDQKSNWPEVVSLFLAQGEKWRGGGANDTFLAPVAPPFPTPLYTVAYCGGSMQWLNYRPLPLFVNPLHIIITGETGLTALLGNYMPY